MTSDSKVVNYTLLNAGVCELLIAGSEQGICKIDFGANENLLIEWIKRHIKNVTIRKGSDLLRPALEEILQYINKERKEFTLKLDLIGTKFQKAVYKEMINIPYGETATYKDLALKLGGIGYSRAVGNAANRNPLPIIIPCHRVIGSNGRLTGYAGGLNIKEFLLNLERSH